jgi:membrane associated rhomboid family serine protease
MRLHRLCALAGLFVCTLAQPAMAEDTQFTKPREVEAGCVGRSLRLPRDMRGFSGTVTVKFAVQPNGATSHFEVLSDVPDVRLATAIRRAVLTCRFSPGTDAAGTPLAVWMILPLRFDPGAPREVAGWPAPFPSGRAVVVLVLLAYAGFIFGWRLLGRRLGLTGPRAPRRDELSRDAYLRRRSLRALLAFDFLVIFPVISGAIVALVVGAPGMVVIGLLPALFFVAPIPFLLNAVRKDDRRRQLGLPAETAAEAASVGHPSLDLLLAGPIPATSSAISLIAGVTVLAWVLPSDLLFSQLAKENELILGGQYWRLLTVALVHGSIGHLAGNLLVLNQVARPVERFAGPGAFLLVLVSGIIAGSLASVAFIPLRSVGVSGGVFAVAAALVVFGWRHRRELPAEARRKIVRATATTLAINLAITFSLPFIDWAAHLGGLVAGAILGWLLKPTAACLTALAESRTMHQTIGDLAAKAGLSPPKRPLAPRPPS